MEDVNTRVPRPTTPLINFKSYHRVPTLSKQTGTIVHSCSSEHIIMHHQPPQ